ncbi:hypothetical protein BJP36_15710 [Moorena producens JHB]|uniref:Uncharacterized protein n=1 Tax=Moorena producens (strain JHB) TaxID=1454205 RepID=A0A1D9G0T4_MOOP1|nr:hypothetical protein [Moorena producens]AOY81134.1 hypothetical protein BJP36_15710 [Moorena producens JHB]
MTQNQTPEQQQENQTPEQQNTNSESSYQTGDKENLVNKLMEIINHPYLLNKISHYPPIVSNFLVFFLVLLTGENATEIAREIAKPQGYFEHQIIMDDVCKTLESGIKASLKPNEKFIDSKSDLSDGKELWPVFRWKCVFQVQVQEINEKKELVTINKIEEGLDLKAYCQKQFNYRSHGFYKDYKNPNSFFCTHVHYENGL